jgi:hypothetical protein
MGFERQIPALQAKLKDDVVNQILADGVKKNDEIDDMPTYTSEEKAARIEAYMNWIATDPGLDFVGKKPTYDDDAYREILKKALNDAPAFLLMSSEQINKYTESESQNRKEIRDRILLVAPYLYNSMKAMIKRVNPSVISQLINSEQDTQKKNNIIEALDLIKNMKSEQEITVYIQNRLNELDTTPQAMESDADKAAKSDIEDFIEKMANNTIAHNQKKIGGILGFGGTWKENPIIRTNVESLKTSFLKYDYQNLLGQLDSINKDKNLTLDEKVILFDYVKETTQGLMNLYNNGAVLLADTIGLIKQIQDNAEYYRKYYAGYSSGSSSSFSSEESSRSSSSSSSTMEEPIVETPMVEEQEEVEEAPVVEEQEEVEEPGYTERYSELLQEYN